MFRVAVISVHGCPNPTPNDTGGMNIYLNSLSRELGRRGIKVDVYTLRHDPSLPQVEEFAENARVIHLEAGNSGPGAKELLYNHLPDFLCSLLRFTDENRLRYDLVHSHYWLSGWVGNVLRSRWNIPHVVTFHTLGEMKNRARPGVSETDLRIATEKEAIVSADRLVATSCAEKKHLTGFYGADAARIEVIPCGVDTDLFRPQDRAGARRALNANGSRVALFVGRIDPVKGIDLLLHALASLEDKDGLRLFVVGGDSGDGELERLLALKDRLGLADRVSFLGAVEHRSLPLYYNAADVCLVSSYYESFCMVALESLACGTPVIASRVGYLDSIVRHGENGYIIDGHCPEPFAERLELLLSNPVLQRTFSRNAHASEFAWPAIADRIVRLYREARG